MKLYFANTSPYARKVRMAVIEKGVDDLVEQIFQNPFEDSPDLKAANPLGKVPALVLNDGSAIFDSAVICAHLDTLSSGVRLYPDGTELWMARTGEAMTDGILDAAFATVMERRRPEGQRSDEWLDRWHASIMRASDAINDELSKPDSRFSGKVTIAHLGLGAALGYLDFRLPDISWREGRESLSLWFKSFSERPSMKATEPPKG
jgi:glutathione S-transferase